MMRRTTQADLEMRMDTEVLFNVEDADDGGYVATAPLHGIVTQADSIDELHAQVRDAVACHFDAADKPKLIRLHFVRDEVLAA
jgi:predicted RNase H-like HicB family nuclease